MSATTAADRLLTRLIADLQSATALHVAMPLDNGALDPPRWKTARLLGHLERAVRECSVLVGQLRDP